MLTRAARALRVTMMMGQTGRYFEIRRAVFPLTMSACASKTGVDIPSGQDKDRSSILLESSN